MTFAGMHDYFEKNCPDGAGIALRADQIAAIAANAAKQLETPIPGVNSNVPLSSFPRLAFSFSLDHGSFQLAAGGSLSLSITLTIHPSGRPQDAIMSMGLAVANQQIEVANDLKTNTLSWSPANSVKPAISAMSAPPHADTNLVAAGYVDPQGNADWTRFNSEFYYGFVWVTTNYLVASILASLPFPQIQRWLKAVTLNAPITAEWQGEYLAVWSNSVKINTIYCGTAPPSGSSASVKWRSGVMPTGPLSHIDPYSPRHLFYLSAQPLVDWKAGDLMPSVTYDETGGSIIDWEVTATVALKSLVLTLQPTSTGGSLQLDGELFLTGSASVWPNQPCNLRHGEVSESVQGNASLKAAVSVSYVPSTLSVDLDASINVAVDQSSVIITGSGLWPVQEVVNDIVQILVNRGVIEIPPLYQSNQHGRILDFSKIAQSKVDRFAINQRVASRSVLYGIEYIAG